MIRLVSLLRTLPPACSQALSGRQALLTTSSAVNAGIPYKFLTQSSSTAARSSKNGSETTPRNFLFETRGSARRRKNQKKASLVIFDKDGTLICFHSMWSRWAVKVTENIAEAVGKDIETKLYEALGVCPQTKRVFPGLLAEMTTPVIKEELTQLLMKEGLPLEKARQAVDSSWVEGDTGSGGTAVKSIHPQLVTLFKILKANNIKIAICTADNRRGTTNTLRHLGLQKYVDMVVCGDDPGTEPKPSPRNAVKICQELNIDPQATVMVGDTKADVGMGKAANLGWIVGVLSGVGDTQELLPEANYVIDNVKDILPLILPNDEWVNCYTYSSHERLLIEPHDLEPETEEVETINFDNIDVVIFDLHGTLVCPRNKYINWLDKLSMK